MRVNERAKRSPRHVLSDLELVDQAQAGDSASFDVLVDRYRRFVRSRSRGFFIVGGDQEDLEQEALIGFHKSVRDFKPELQASFRSFAELCITRQIITAIKAANRFKHGPLNQAVSISAARSEHDDRSDDEVYGAVAPHADPLEQLVASEELGATRDALIAGLSTLEIDVLTRFVAGRTYEQIAAELGRHTKAVDNALQRIKRKVTAHLESQMVDA